LHKLCPSEVAPPKDVALFPLRTLPIIALVPSEVAIPALAFLTHVTIEKAPYAVAVQSTDPGHDVLTLGSFVGMMCNATSNARRITARPFTLPRNHPSVRNRECGQFRYFSPLKR
jgi:hypothetical protein